MITNLFLFSKLLKKYVYIKFMVVLPFVLG